MRQAVAVPVRVQRHRQRQRIAAAIVGHRADQRRVHVGQLGGHGRRAFAHRLRCKAEQPAPQTATRVARGLGPQLFGGVFAYRLQQRIARDAVAAFDGAQQ